jgi:hypothetical protein
MERNYSVFEGLKHLYLRRCKGRLSWACSQVSIYRHGFNCLL